MNDSASERFFADALAHARACRTDGDLSGALRELRAGLDASMNYGGLVAAARFLENTTKDFPLLVTPRTV